MGRVRSVLRIIFKIKVCAIFWQMKPGRHHMFVADTITVLFTVSHFRRNNPQPLENIHSSSATKIDYTLPAFKIVFVVSIMIYVGIILQKAKMIRHLCRRAPCVK
jgi:hypothetical protein